MVAIVMGIRRCIDFTSDDGKRISGTKLHICYDDPLVEGKAVKSLFVKSDIPTDFIEIGMDYDFIYESNFGGRAYLTSIKEVIDNTMPK